MALAEFAKGRPCIPSSKLLPEKLGMQGLPEFVYSYMPDVKLIAIVKEPTDRVLSQYLHRLGHDYITSDVADFDAYVKQIYRPENQTALDKRVSWEPVETAPGDFERVPVYVSRRMPWVNMFDCICSPYTFQECLTSWNRLTNVLLEEKVVITSCVI